MKRRRPVKRLLRAATRALVPPRVLKYSIALRNYRRGEPEIRLLSSLVDARRDALDVGAFTGAYTFFLRRLARHVHAFEPQPQCARFLAAAYGRGITVHACALGAQPGFATLALPLGEETSQGARVETGLHGDADRIRVEVQTLDQQGLDAVGFIKIDAEGAERAILEGGLETIRRCRPVLLVEIEERHIGGDIRTVFEYVLGLGYDGYYLHAGSLRSIDSFDPALMQRARLAGDKNRPYINNFIFRPRAR